MKVSLTPTVASTSVNLAPTTQTLETQVPPASFALQGVTVLKRASPARPVRGEKSAHQMGQQLVKTVQLGHTLHTSVPLHAIVALLERTAPELQQLARRPALTVKQGSTQKFLVPQLVSPVVLGNLVLTLEQQVRTPAVSVEQEPTQMVPLLPLAVSAVLGDLVL